ncbi:ATP-binding protein [Paraconexibacter sp. AEG42_29]|uniref:sensor histidine kinase n=1 Tax=Paraconexibacter sp. AEG42_29 TaxID=2997339 RepID=UPI00339D3EB3
MKAPPTLPTVPWTSPELRDGVKAIAIMRAVAVPVLAIAGFLRDETHLLAFAVLAIVAMTLELWQLRIIYSGRWAKLPLPQLLFMDIGMVAVAMALTGGIDSPIAYIGLLTIFTATFAFSARFIGQICAWTWIACGGVAVTDGINQGDGRAVVTYIGALVFTSVLSVNAARVRERTSEHLRELAASRRRLVVDAAQLEAGDRRRISQQLHDQALQVILAARQDLDEVAAGDPNALQFARDALQNGLQAVRATIYDIDPSALAGTRLPEALQAMVERVAANDSVLIGSSIALDASGPHDDLLYAVARELVRHATDDPGIRRVAIELRRDGSAVHLTVTDDGPPPPSDGYPEGTVGIASAAARLEAVGGTLSLHPQPHGGTRVAILVADAAPGA